jgi:hypothetical protein
MSTQAKLEQIFSKTATNTVRKPVPTVDKWDAPSAQKMSSKKTSTLIFEDLSDAEDTEGKKSPRFPPVSHSSRNANSKDTPPTPTKEIFEDLSDTDDNYDEESPRVRRVAHSSRNENSKNTPADPPPYKPTKREKRDQLPINLDLPFANIKPAIFYRVQQNIITQDDPEPRYVNIPTPLVQNIQAAYTQSMTNENCIVCGIYAGKYYHLATEWLTNPKNQKESIWIGKFQLVDKTTIWPILVDEFFKNRVVQNTVLDLSGCIHLNGCPYHSLYTANRSDAAPRRSDAAPRRSDVKYPPPSTWHNPALLTDD